MSLSKKKTSRKKKTARRPSREKQLVALVEHAIQWLRWRHVGRDLADELEAGLRSAIADAEAPVGTDDT